MSKASANAPCNTSRDHTPGPWKWDGYSLRPENPNPDAHAVHTILEVDTFAYGFVDSDLAATTAECAANRALIEAAPDLLASLREALKIVDAYRRASGGDGDITAMNARAAIAKATAKVGADEAAIRPAEAVDTAQPTSMPHSLYNEPEGE
jgi:hypothetical protein